MLARRGGHTQDVVEALGSQGQGALVAITEQESVGW